jgi:hypothetical protein
MRLAVYLSVGFFFVVFPVSTLAAQAWEQRNWPTLQAKIIEVVPIEGTNKRRVTYRYKVLGRVIEKTQTNWNVPWWDRINNTELDFKVGDLVTIYHHPHNVMLSIFKPGNFAHPNFGRLKGEVIEDATKPARRPLPQVGPH